MADLRDCWDAVRGCAVNVVEAVAPCDIMRKYIRGVTTAQTRDEGIAADQG
jgi:hypothetical protein